jgi:hypothetical protein
MVGWSALGSGKEEGEGGPILCEGTGGMGGSLGGDGAAKMPSGRGFVAGPRGSTAPHQSW